MFFACKSATRAGVFLSGLAALPFVYGAGVKFWESPGVVRTFERYGWPEPMIRTLAILEICSLALYLIPQVSILGAILLTGFLGGAIATHLRIGEPVYLHVAIGILLWAGLFLREPRLRVLIPIRGRE
jgi:hypothetical protein